jgi:hypothetical protein
LLIDGKLEQKHTMRNRYIELHLFTLRKYNIGLIRKTDRINNLNLPRTSDDKFENLNKKDNKLLPSSNSVAIEYER